MDIREEGKSRSQRINIDYYRQKTWLSRSRGLLALAATILTAGYCVYVLASGNASHLSTGPVASAHASFENECRKCHLDFTPISRDSLRFNSSTALDRLEEACQQCHRVDHHFRGMMKPEFATLDQHCSGCHTDHLGRDNNLVNVASGKCTNCHGDLAATCLAGKQPQVKSNVTGFSLEAHGDFASLKNGDPGRIKFDHAQHMLPGQVDAGMKGAFTLGNLEANLREAYRKQVKGTLQGDDALVTLSCADCHQFAGVVGQPLVGDDEVGRHISPISFDQHCAACHPINDPARTKDTLPLPHAAPWKEIEMVIASKLVGGQQLGSIRMPRDTNRKTPLVGEGMTGSLQRSADENKERAIIAAKVSEGRAAAEAQCLKCHEPNDITDQAIASLRSTEAAPLIPERWFSKGIYDHAAHRKIDCSFCHADAYAKSAVGPVGEIEVVQGAIAENGESAEQASSVASTLTHSSDALDSERVMIGGIETCTGCHRSAETPVPASITDESVHKILGGQSNWASDACIECHRYHWERPIAPDSVPAVTEPPASSQAVSKEAVTQEAVIAQGQKAHGANADADALTIVGGAFP